MTASEIVFLIIELIGVIAFAVSGAMKAIIKGLDIIGVIALALITTLAGGFLRDLTLGITPKLLVDKRYYMYEIIDVAVAIICFIYVYIKSKKGAIDDVNSLVVLSITDAIGLGVFAIFGVKLAIGLGHTVKDDMLLLLFSGLMSGVGGGITRDVLVGEIPIVFRKYVYLLPTLGGSLLYIILVGYTKIPDIISVIIGVAFICVIRILAILRRWNLPSIKHVDIKVVDNKTKGR